MDELTVKAAKYAATVSRISSILADLDARKNSPISDVANHYRIATEAICKAIIYSSNAEPAGDLNRFIADAGKIIEESEGSRDAALFKASATYIRNVGNLFSHDGQNSVAAASLRQEDLTVHLASLIRIGFFGTSDLDPPDVPQAFRLKLSARMLKRNSFEDIHSELVVRLCFPKQTVSTRVSKNEKSARLVYDYVIVDLGGGLSRGFIFLRSRSSIEKCIKDLLNDIGNSLPDGLSVVTPRIYGASGDAVDRKRSIGEILDSLRIDYLIRKRADVVYFDEFVWENCLPDTIRNVDNTQQDVPFFIPQILETNISDQVNERAIDSIKYTKSVLEGSQQCNPIHVITGPAGIGKTTFCDNVRKFVDLTHQKRVIFISATDFRDARTEDPINSVSAIYKLAAECGSFGEAPIIESQNFEVNLSCGNFVLIIDGFDELESNLGGSLNFDSFMESLREIEDRFHRAFVILTVRDYNIERFEALNYISVLRLRGFTNDDTDRYFRSRLQQSKIGEAKRLLASFRSSDDDRATTIPLYASLICDFLAEEALPDDVKAYRGARYFESGGPLDVLVKKIIDREIVKQSFGDISSDDFFDIIIAIITSAQMTVSRDTLSEYIKSCGGNDGTLSAQKLLSNPFLQYSGGAVRFKYDSLVYYFKSRALYRRIIEGTSSTRQSIEFMSDLYRGDGTLFDELVKILKPSDYSRRDCTRKWFGCLRNYREDDELFYSNWRRAISGFLYWAIEDDQSKADRKKTLSYLFEGDIWEKFTVFGRFAPLDLSNIIIYDGHIENYTNIVNCEYGGAKHVFHRSWVEFEESVVSDKLDRG